MSQSTVDHNAREMTSPTPTALLEPTSARPRSRTLLFAWVLTALAGSFLVWLADVAFYGRFGVLASDLPSWDAWSALELGVQLFACAVVLALWLWWPRRLAVVAAAAVVLAGVGAGGGPGLTTRPVGPGKGHRYGPGRCCRSPSRPRPQG